MADQSNLTPEERHFAKVYNYVNWTSAAILIIAVLLFFVEVPAKNEKFVDIGFGILLGILSSNSGTITGNTSSAKKPDAQIIQTGEQPTATTTPNEQ